MVANPTRFVRACSPWFDEMVGRYPDAWADLERSGRLESRSPPSEDTLHEQALREGLDPALRRFRNLEMMRIIWRELSQTAPLTETLSDLSLLAERCLEEALGGHREALEQRFGTPRDSAGRRLNMVVLGLGKLGGHELNLSSDIDLIFCFAEAGHCDGPRHLANEQFFTRLARATIKSLSTITEDGFVFRVDTRLRPFGEAGPLVCSFGALEQYYQREGRDWERYALLKARPVAGDLQAGKQLLKTLNPFVYRRYIDFGAVEALREMLDAIRADAARKGRGRDIKRGQGGIREVEFLVQCVQLLRGGRELSLQTPSLMTALNAMEALALFPAQETTQWRTDYSLLRRVENAIQALHDQQTHELPEGEDLDRVARVLGFSECSGLTEAIEQTRQRVSRALENHFPHSERLETADGSWRDRIEHGEPDEELRSFLQRTDRMALGPRAQRRLDAFMPLLLNALDRTGLTGEALRDVMSLVRAICRRSAYLSLLVQNPQALHRMLQLFATSDWVANTVIRYPALLDELIDPALGSDLPDRRTLTAMAQRMARGEKDEESAISALNYIKRAQSLRIAVAELEGGMSSQGAERALTELAEVLLDSALTLGTATLEQKHGALDPGGLAVIGYGSLGAGDVSYGSDLDLVFLYPDNAQTSDGPRPLPAETYYTRLVRRLLALTTTHSPAGRLYEIDTRLRPNGRSGLLVSSIKSYERYQKNEAWTWELQALVRARLVAGNRDLAADYQRIRQAALSRDPGGKDPRAEIIAMRKKIRQDVNSKDGLKQDPGGLLDIDFIAQMGILELAHKHPETAEHHDTRGQLRSLAALGWIDPAQAKVLEETHAALTRARHMQSLRRVRTMTSVDTTNSQVICASFGL